MTHPKRRTVAAAAAILTVAFLAGSGAPPRLSATRSAPTAASTAQAMDDYLTGLLDSEHFLGAVVVARGTDVLLSKGYGRADTSTTAANTPHTRFRIGSVTKQFTALAILKLQELGKLKVTDRVCRYVTPCPGGWAPITIEHLLTHTSGIPNYTSFRDFGAVRKNTLSPEQLVDLFRDKSTHFTPGARWQYSNSGYVLLGYIIERVTGDTYANYLRRQILEPLGLGETGYDVNHPSTLTHATGYHDWGHTPAHFLDDMSTAYAAGAMFSSATDLYRWNRFLLTGKPPIVSATSFAQMFTPRAQLDPAHPDTSAWYGYGWIVGSPTATNAWSSHFGGIDGFVAFNAIRPHQQVSITVLSNTTYTNMDAIAAKLTEIVGP